MASGAVGAQGVAASDGPSASAGAQFPLVGMDGAKFVSETLASRPPHVAVRTIASAAGLPGPLCAALLGVVDQLGLSRFDAHRAVLLAARQQLLAQVASAPPGAARLKLERLLAASFKYLGIADLRDIPLAVMERLEQVPPVFLKQLALDKQIFRELPAKVQRQVWEFDKNLLQADALAPVGQYKYEVGAVMRAMAADEFLPAVLAATDAARQRVAAAGAAAAAGGPAPGAKRPRAVLDMSDDEDAQGPTGTATPRARFSGGRGAGPAGGPRSGRGLPAPRPVTRKILRKGSFVVQLLRGMVGGSAKIYSQLVELCLVRYRDGDGLYVGHKEASYCTLRAQLLMALHDMSSAVATRDRCHELAWTLDAGITNGHLTEKHLQKLEKFFADLEKGEAEAAARLQAAKRRRAEGVVQDEAESAGNVLGGGAAGGGVVIPYRLLGDAAAILRDPSAMHLLAGAVFQMVLPAAIEHGTLPAAVPGLGHVLRMMALGVDGRAMLRDSKYRMPEPDVRITAGLLPVLAAWALQAEAQACPPCDQLVGTELPGGWGVPAAALEPVQALLPRSEVARRLAQAFALERLLSRDWLGCARTCKLLASCLKAAAIQEGWDFAGSMAQRLAELVRARTVLPGCSVWHYAVDGLLLRAVDAHTQVHEEVLRLLLAAAPHLTAEELGAYLGAALENSKRSRRRLGRKGLPTAAALADFPMALAGEGGSDIGGSDIGSDGWAGITQLKLSASDNVRSVYAQFTRLHNVTQQSAPALYAYLAESAKDAGDLGAMEALRTATPPPTG